MHADRGASLRTIAHAALCCAIAGCVGASAQTPNGYAVRQSYVLTPPRDHMRGRIELLEDARMRPEMREAITGAYGSDPCANRPPSVLAALCSDPHRAPLRPAVLRLVDAGGHVVAARTLERPVAELGGAGLYGNNGRDRRSYTLTVDLSAGAGSYSGPYTRFVDPDEHGFNWLLVDSAGVADTLTMVSTLKTRWAILRDQTDPYAQFLMVRCRPDINAPVHSVAFLTTFERITFDGTHWRLHARSEPGCYESDEPFPPRSKFP